MSKQRKTVASTYLYDPLDRLAASNSIQRFYNDTRITTEIEGERKSRFFETDSQPLALQQHGSLPGTTLLATDQQTSVLNGVSPEGALHAQAYSPFGHHPIGTSLNGAGFNGERPEPLTGHYLLGQGYRAFNPVLMRFNSPDSWSPFGEGGINAYAYCDNDPANKVDPTGHIPNLWKGLKNLFGRVPKRLRPSTVAASTGPSSQPVSAVINQANHHNPLPEAMLRRPNFSTQIPATVNDPDIVGYKAVNKTTAFLNAQKIEPPKISLQAFAAPAVPKYQLSNLPRHTRNKIMQPFKENYLSEFQQAFNSQGSVPAKQEFLTLLRTDRPAMLSDLPKKLRSIIRNG